MISQNNFYISVLWKNDSSREPFKITCHMFDKISLSGGPIASLSAIFEGGNTPVEAFIMGVIISSVENTSYFVMSQNLICDIKKSLLYVISKNLFCI